jgi:hypothetical protein
MPLKKNVTQQCVDASGNNTHASFPTQKKKHHVDCIAKYSIPYYFTNPYM